MQPLRIQLDWKPNAQFAGITYAHHHGWYRDVGIDLTISPWEPYTNQMDALDSDENIVVSTEDNLHIRAALDGKPVIAIGTMIQQSGIGWMTLADAGLRSVADFRGKRVGIHEDGRTALMACLAANEVPADEVEIVEVGFNYDELLGNREFDAIQCLVIVEPLELKRQGYDLYTIPGYASGYKVYSQVIVTTKHQLNTQEPMLEAFLKVTFDGWRAAFDDVSKACTIITEHYLPEAIATEQEQMLAALKPLVEGDLGLTHMGLMHAARWQQSMDYLREQGYSLGDLSPDALMTNHLIKRIYSLE